MSACDLFNQYQYIHDIDLIAERHGMELELSCDFEAFRKIRMSQPERLPISPIFDCQESELNASSGFWIKGINENGELVHLQAVRLLDLDGMNLAQHLHAQRRIYAPPGTVVDAERSEFSATPASHRITGKVCYHGELWLKGGPNGYRGHGLTAALPRLAMVLAYQTWSPDFMFGLVHPMVACKGLPAREGYMHLEPGGILWQLKNSDEVLDEWLVWMSRTDLQYLLRFPPLKLYEQLEAKSKERAAFTSQVKVAA